MLGLLSSRGCFGLTLAAGGSRHVRDFLLVGLVLGEDNRRFLLLLVYLLNRDRCALMGHLLKNYDFEKQL